MRSFYLIFANHVVCMTLIFAELVIFSVHGFDLLSLMWVLTTMQST